MHFKELFFYTLASTEIEPDFEIPDEVVTAPPQVKFESAPSFVPSEELDGSDVAALETITRTRWVDYTNKLFNLPFLFQFAHHR